MTGEFKIKMVHAKPCSIIPYGPDWALVDYMGRPSVIGPIWIPRDLGIPAFRDATRADRWTIIQNHGWTTVPATHQSGIAPDMNLVEVARVQFDRFNLTYTTDLKRM